MNIEQMSDRKLARERTALGRWIFFARAEEHESGEVEDWNARLKLVDAEITRRDETGKETR